MVAVGYFVIFISFGNFPFDAHCQIELEKIKTASLFPRFEQKYWNKINIFHVTLNFFSP